MYDKDEFPALLPYDALMMPYSPEWRLEATKKHSLQWTNLKMRSSNLSIPRRVRDVSHREPLVVAYFSYDFRSHAMGYLTRGFLQHHRRDRVRVVAYSYGPNDGSRQRERLIQAVGTNLFRDVQGMTGEDVATLVAQDGVHVAVDLMSHTTGSRQELMASQPAPVSVSYLGYPSTSGATYSPLIIVDKVVAPPENRHHFSEHLVYLPQTYQSNDYPMTSSVRLGSTVEDAVLAIETCRNVVHDAIDVRLLALRSSLQRELGELDDVERARSRSSSFRFVNFNKITKLEPIVFRAWARILRRVPNSTLLLLEPRYESAKRRLFDEMAAQGVRSTRLRWAPMIDRHDHLNRIAHDADLFLDTFVYNAHTTATDALWSGTPVLTMTGPDFASRVATSHLRQVDLDILVTSSLREYEDTAVRLATSSHVLDKIRRHLAGVVFRVALFDTVLITRRLEQAHEAMWDVFAVDRHDEHDVAGTKHIAVAAGSTRRAVTTWLTETLDMSTSMFRRGLKVDAARVLRRLIQFRSASCSVLRSLD